MFSCVGTIGKVFPRRETRILLKSVENGAYLRLLVCVCFLVLFIRCFWWFVIDASFLFAALR